MSVDYKCHIFEEVNVSEYNDEDFIEAFVMEFRPWIKKNHGDEVGEYPMSLLVKKYIKEFSAAIGVPESRLRHYNTVQQMRAIGVEIVTSGMRKLPTLSKDFLFTEKFKKIIDYFISSYNLPDFIKVHLEETSPFSVLMLLLAVEISELCLFVSFDNAIISSIFLLAVRPSRIFFP